MRISGFRHARMYDIESSAFRHNLGPEILVHLLCMLGSVEYRVSALEFQHETDHAAVQVEVHQ